MSKTPPIAAFNVLNFIRRAAASAGAPPVRPAPVDRERAAQIITMPTRTTAAPAPAGEPSPAVVARVTEQVDKIFNLKGAVRDQMIADISGKIFEDPRASKLIAS